MEWIFRAVGLPFCFFQAKRFGLMKRDTLVLVYLVLATICFSTSLLAAASASDIAQVAADAFRSLAAKHHAKDWISKQDGAALAWQESYALMGYVVMFEGSGDPVYLDTAMERFDEVLKARSDQTRTLDEIRGRVLPAWNSTAYTSGRSYAWIVHAGMITYPMARSAYLIRRDAKLYGRFGRKADGYLRAVEETVQAFDDSWREDKGGSEGWYYDDYLRKGMPFNMQNAMGRSLIALWLATGKDEYRIKAERLARFFRNRLRKVEDRYEWSYWPEGGRSEDISHAGINVGFAFDSFRAGLVFTREDMIRFASTLKWCGRGEGGFTKYIDGEGDYTLSARMGQWGQLGYVVPEARELIYQDFRKNWRANAFNAMIAAAYLVEAKREFRQDQPALVVGRRISQPD